jgi:hypothetical protein
VSHLHRAPLRESEGRETQAVHARRSVPALGRGPQARRCGPCERDRARAMDGRTYRGTVRAEDRARSQGLLSGRRCQDGRRLARHAHSLQACPPSWGDSWKASTDGYVLSGLRANKYGDRSGAASKRLIRLKRALRFGKQHVFHSIRKTVATQFENALVLETSRQRSWATSSIRCPTAYTRAARRSR